MNKELVLSYLKKKWTRVSCNTFTQAVWIQIIKLDYLKVKLIKYENWDQKCENTI